MTSFFKHFWDSNTSEDDEKELEIELMRFKPELDSISSFDSVISIFRLVNLEKTINQYLSKQFNNKLTNEEHTGIYDLFLEIHEQAITSQSQLNVYSKTKIAMIILCYFSSLSPTNIADGIDIWNGWIDYLMGDGILSKLGSVKNSDLKRFYDTLAQEIGYDGNGGMIWFISTERVDDYIDNDTQRKAFLLFILSLHWDLKTNTFDLNILRRGLKAHYNLSHFSMTRVSWATVKAGKDVIAAFPYSLSQIYIRNTPFLMAIFKIIASKFFVAQSWAKFIWLDGIEQYFAEYAPRDTTPVGHGGTLKLHTTEWMENRGYFEYEFY